MKEETLSNPEASETPNGEQVASDALLSRYPIAAPEDMEQAIMQINSMRRALTKIVDTKNPFARRRIAANCLGFWQRIAGMR